MLAGYTAYNANALSYLSDDSAACGDCHVPNTMELRVTRTGSTKVTQHNITSPLKDINAACKSCHTQSEDYLKKQVSNIQKSIAFDLRSVKYATVRLIMDIKNMRERLGALPEFQTNGKAGDRYYEHSNINDAPAADKLELDKNNKPYNFNKIDPKLF